MMMLVVISVFMMHDDDGDDNLDDARQARSIQKILTSAIGHFKHTSNKTSGSPT